MSNNTIYLLYNTKATDVKLHPGSRAEINRSNVSREWEYFDKEEFTIMYSPEDERQYTDIKILSKTKLKERPKSAHELRKKPKGSVEGILIRRAKSLATFERDSVAFRRRPLIRPLISEAEITRLQQLQDECGKRKFDKQRPKSESDKNRISSQLLSQDQKYFSPQLKRTTKEFNRTKHLGENQTELKHKYQTDLDKINKTSPLKHSGTGFTSNKASKKDEKSKTLRQDKLDIVSKTRKEQSGKDLRNNKVNTKDNGLQLLRDTKPGISSRLDRTPKIYKDTESEKSGDKVKTKSRTKSDQRKSSLKDLRKPNEKEITNLKLSNKYEANLKGSRTTLKDSTNERSEKGEKAKKSENTKQKEIKSALHENEDKIKGSKSTLKDGLEEKEKKKEVKESERKPHQTSAVSSDNKRSITTDNLYDDKNKETNSKQDKSLSKDGGGSSKAKSSKMKKGRTSSRESENENLDLATLSEKTKISKGKKQSKTETDVLSAKGKATSQRGKKASLVQYVIEYILSNPVFTKMGWTLPTTDPFSSRMVTFIANPANPKTYFLQTREEAVTTFYSTGFLALKIHEDGSGRLNYPSGSPAIIVDKVDSFFIMTLYSDPKMDPLIRESFQSTILGKFDSFGNGVVYNLQAKKILNFNQMEGFYNNPTRNLPYKWQWGSYKMLEEQRLKVVLASMVNEVKKTPSPSIKKGKDLKTALNIGVSKKSDIDKTYEAVLAELPYPAATNFKVKKPVHKPGFKAIILKINDEMTLRINDQDNITLNFSTKNFSYKIDLGVKIVPESVARIDEIAKDKIGLYNVPCIFSDLT